MKITEEIKIEINNLYLKYGTYAQVAREIGCSAGTIKKYVIKDYVPAENINKIVFTEYQIPNIINYELFQKENLGELCQLDSNEYKLMEELWKELVY